ncbi:MAG: ATPase, T2SS/T4P/T4SS family [Rickettsiales bacterium]|nr:ATPase, T2SS/T4P/T4SS family [Rickettsiales bacterium]
MMFGKKKDDGSGAFPVDAVPITPAEPAGQPVAAPASPPSAAPMPPVQPSVPPAGSVPHVPSSVPPTPPPPADAGANLPVNVMQPEQAQQQTDGALVASQERMLAEQESLLEQRKKMAEAARGKQSAYTDRNLETPDYIKAKLLISEELLERLDFEELEKTGEEDRRQEILDEINALIEKVNLPLTAAQHELLKKSLLDDVLGFGPLEVLLADPDVSDIMVNGANQVYIEKAGKISVTDVRFVSERHLLNVIQKIVQRVGRRVDETSPMVDARMPDGSRFNAIIPPLALDGSLVSIRKFKQNKMPLTQYIDYGSATPEMVRFLEICSQIRMNILISGGTGSGKTTLLNALSGHIEEGERVITIEDAAELQMHQPHVLRLETRPANMEGVGEVTQRALVKNALRMRPDRIILGEIRGEEVIDVLQAMNTGHDGSMATIHANNPRECLTRLENLFGLTGLNFPLSTLRNQIAGSLNMVVQISRMRDGSRKITQIEEIVGMEGDVIITQTLFHFKPTGMSEDGKLQGQFICNGVKPRFMEQASYYGLDQEMSQTLTGSPGMM